MNCPMLAGNSNDDKIGPTPRGNFGIKIEKQIKGSIKENNAVKLPHFTANKVTGVASACPPHMTMIIINAPNDNNQVLVIGIS